MRKKKQPWTKEELRKHLMSDVIYYDENMVEITNPKSDRYSQGNINFERNVLIDHLIMTFEYYLELKKENG